ncbi:GHMP kinase [Candidatus Parcubacteria bacterium]|nr:GHMP kinase [Candidatus Parcubacteria bacterium]
MIISKTPLRISFVGGGTDLRAFYKNEPGKVISTAINKYIYICVHKHFDGESYLLKYSKIEEGKDIDKIKNDIIREAFKLTGVSGVEIVSMSDAPVSGVGLGSSSSFAVGLLNALYSYKGENKTPEELAQEACKIEIDILKKPIGKQDQYIAAYGGLKTITFNPDESVKVENIPVSENLIKGLDSNLLLFYTGKTRNADQILSKQKINTQDKIKSLIKMRGFVNILKEDLINSDIDKIGELLHQNWLEKKQLANGISDPEIDINYQKAINQGALGGKICGAGGGGFFLFYAKKENQEKIRQALKNLKETPFGFEPEGSKIIHKL